MPNTLHRRFNLVVNVYRSRAGNKNYFLVRAPTLAEWAKKVCWGYISSKVACVNKTKHHHNKIISIMEKGLLTGNSNDTIIDAQVRTSMSYKTYLFKSTCDVVFGFSWWGRCGCRKRWANLIVAHTFQELGLVRIQSASAFLVPDMLAAHRSPRDAPFCTHWLIRFLFTLL